jgi:predicted permease
MASQVRSFLRALLGWRHVEREMKEEWQFHVEARTADLVASGLPAPDAARRARQEFGDTSRWTEDVRQMRGLRWFDECRRDVAYAVRQMQRAPWLTAAVVGTLVLAIGASTAIFSVADAILLEPLPYRAPDELVMVWSNNTREGRAEYPMSPGNFFAYRERARTVRQVEQMYSFLNSSVWQDGAAERVTVSSVGPGMFALLGHPALIGRTPGDRETGVGVLSSGFWTRRYGRDPAIVGRRVVIDSQPVAIIGVMPDTFEFPFKGMLGPSGFVTANEPDVWVTTDEKAVSSRMVDASGRPVRAQHFLSVIARIAPGATLAQVSAEANAIAAQLEKEFPTENAGLSATVRAAHDQALGTARGPIELLFGGVAVVLMIACGNVGNLLFARSIARQREFAVRGALGAHGGRLLRQLLVESMCLASVSGVLGALVALVAVPVLVSLAPADLPRIGRVSADRSVLLFAVAVSLFCGLVTGLIPAILAARANLHDALKDGGRGGSTSRARVRLRTAIVIGEIALAAVLTLGAGVLVRSFVAVLNVDPGFRPDGLLTLQVTIPSRITAPDARLALYRNLFARLEALPGVLSAGGTTRLPLGSGNVTSRVALSGQSAASNALAEVEFRRALHNYFPAMGILIVRGRDFTEADGLPGAEPVVLVNESMARRYWPGADPIEQRVRMGADPAGVWSRVVGVVGDVHHSGLDLPPAPEMYVTYLQNPPVAPFIAIRTSGDAGAIAASVRDTLRSIDSELAVYDMRTMREVRTASMASRTFVVTLGVLFGLVAVALAAVGIYGVMSLMVQERTQEVGIRRALGARPAEIVMLVTAQAVRIGVAGIVLGVLLFVAISPALRAQLYNVQPIDPVTLAAVPVLLLGVALSGCVAPMLAALRVHPASALRAE